MPRPVHRLIAGATSAALAVAVVLPTASAAPSPDKWLPDLRSSDELTGPVLVRGRFVDSTGRGTGGRVYAIAWPRMDVLGRLEVGDNVKTMPVAKVRTGGDGSFTMKVDPTVAIDEFKEDDGTINFSLYGKVEGHAIAAFAFSRRNAGGAWVEPGVADAAATSEVTLSLGKGSSGIEELATAPAPAIDKLGSCGSIVRATYNDRKDIVGEVYTGAHATGDFTYLNSSDSTLGVGFSVGGSYGSFSQSGTSKASSSAGIDYPTQGLNAKKVFQTSWQYKKIQYYGWDQWGIDCYSEGYEARPTLWWGSSYSYNAASAPTASYCSNQLAGASTWKNQGTAVTFTNGLDLNVGALGIHLSTRTGFDNETKIKFTFQTAGKLCGSNTTWPYAARVVGK